MESSDKVVLVTGATAGIGKACAEYLGSRGFRVYGTGRRAPLLPVPMGSYKVLRMDVTDAESIRIAVDAIMEAEGRIDAVFNNAGTHAVGPIETIPMEEIERSFQTNCIGPMRVARALVPIFRAQGGGRIINMSSLAGVLALPFQGAYSGSKFALEGMTQSLRAEVRRFGIRVSMINPGDIRHQDSHSAAPAPSFYEPYFSNATKTAWADEEQGYPPGRIGRLVERILVSRSPRKRYYFGQLVQAPFMTLKRLLPEAISELAIAAYYRS